MKRNSFVSFMIAIIFVLNIFAVNVAAATTAKEISTYIDDVIVNYVDAVPFIENNRTLVPVRVITEAMGAEVLWDNDTQTVTIRKQNDKIVYNGKEYFNCQTTAVLVIGKAFIEIGLIDNNNNLVFSETKALDTEAKIVNSRTFIPARFVGYSMGYDVSWDQNRMRVNYNFIGKQTLDFEIQDKEEPKPNVGNDKYPDTFVYDEERVYPSRKGYENVIIVDTSNGRIENGKFVNLIPYEFTAENVIIEADKKEYEVSKDNTPEQNFDNFAKFYKDKTGENVKIKTYSNGSKSYKLEYLTNLTNGFETGIVSDGDSLSKYFKPNSQLYSFSCANPIFDWSKMYFYYNGKSGDKVYGSKDDSFLRLGSSKNTLLFLNEFLGESGQRIWKMMSDYYTMSGHFYVQPETHWTKMSSNSVGQVYPDNYDPMSKEIVEKYGFKFVATEMDSQPVLVIETKYQRIHIMYTAINLNYALTSGYYVTFETIED